jgi:hypothetical protein
MQTIGFSAGRAVTPAGESILRYHLARLPQAARYVLGGAGGGDAIIGRYLVWKWPKASFVIIVPANRSQVDSWWEEYLGKIDITVIEMPDGTTYADRNLRIVEESDVLAGFPIHPEDDRRSRRSGTWQTVRYARKAGMPSVWHTLAAPYAGDDSGIADWRWMVK